MNMNCSTSSDFHLRPASPDGHDIFRRTFDNSDVSGGNPVNYSQNPKKKRTKMVRIENSGGVSKPKCGSKKPDPSAPKITKPCSECGKKFWSWKALFGHMRCHPERQWRGINPPPNLRRDSGGGDGPMMTEEDHHIAACLLMLANGPARVITTDDAVAVAVAAMTPPTSGGGVTEPETGIRIVEAYGSVHASLNCGKFECSSCKKVFGSHQALGGHRASHKNVKGCFANTRNEGGELEQMEEVVDVGHGIGVGPTDLVKGNMGINNNDVMMVLGAHQCGICLRVFSSGQALGGHKRCHWEKGEVVPAASGTVLSIVPYDNGGFDLNLPASSMGEDDGDSPSSNLGLDLRLGL